MTTMWRRAVWGIVLALGVFAGLVVVRDIALTEPAPDSVSPGLTMHVGPVARSCTGVTVNVGDPVQEVIDLHPPGTTFCLAPGIHRLETPLVPRRGDVLAGQEGAVLSGSKVLSGWRADGGVWRTTGFLPPAPSRHGPCEAPTSSCAYAEDVFVDKHPLQRVEFESDVVAGTFHADYGTNTIVIGDDPGSRVVEQAVAPSLIRATVDNVTVVNLVLEHAANEAQVGAIENRQIWPPEAGSGWRIQNNEVRYNHGIGIDFASSSTVTGNFVHHQGQLGLGAEGTDSVVRDNEVSFNGTAGYDIEWEAGGIKSWQTERLTLRHNYVHDNVGPGVWTDGGALDTTYEYNRVLDNWSAGLVHEISYDATIRHNEISGNGRRKKGWAWDAGILIQSSGGIKAIEISNNIVTGNANGITLVADSATPGRDRSQEQPAPHGPHVVQNVRVCNNVVTMFDDERTGVFEDAGGGEIFTSNGNEFDANTYHLHSLSESHFAWAGVNVDWTQWRDSGNDVNGRATTESR
ncbi:MAG: right-handed parallel beta-helix repeat-containing protein [Dehalococcoidia bacterium]